MSYGSHFLDSHATYGANDVHFVHPLDHRRDVLLFKLQVPLKLFNNRHFWGGKKKRQNNLRTPRLQKYLSCDHITVGVHMSLIGNWL